MGTRSTRAAAAQAAAPAATSNSDKPSFEEIGYVEDILDDKAVDLGYSTTPKGARLVYALDENGKEMKTPWHLPSGDEKFVVLSSKIEGCPSFEKALLMQLCLVGDKQVPTICRSAHELTLFEHDPAE